VYFRIHLAPHPLFDVEGHNLIITVPVAPWEAALGAKIDVPTLTGAIQMRIPANSQNGKKLRIPGKGLPSKSGHGDLFAVLKVVMPAATGEDVEKLWSQLADIADFDPRAEWSR
jgi:curved DNA-binding protein